MSSDGSLRAPIGVILAGGVRLYREAVAAALRAGAGFAPVDTCGSCAEASAAVMALHPDVAIVDMSMAGAFELAAELRALAPRLRVIAIGIREELAAVVECARARVDGFVTVEASLDDLVAAIERVLAGELLCSPRVAAELFRRVGSRDEQPQRVPPDGGSLTVREQQVLSFLANGLSNKEIAASLHIAEATVKSHVHHVLEKLHVSSRAQAMAHAMRPDALSRRGDGRQASADGLTITAPASR